MIEGLLTALKDVGSEISNSLKECVPNFSKSIESKTKSFEDADKPLKKEEVKDATSDISEDNSKKECNEEYYSSYEERINQTPKEGTGRGEWDGNRGESKFIPSDNEIREILSKYGLDGIEYNNGIPDFSKCSESTVQIDDMTENRSKNFRQCDEKCAEQWNKEGRDGKSDWTARDVANWREENGYSWHERNDRKTCDLVPTKINDYFGHLGGVSECKKHDSNNEGGEFDE